jgi:hypothetical protein
MTISSNGSTTTPERITISARAPVDLHLHTLASDGAWTPSALIAPMPMHNRFSR